MKLIIGLGNPGKEYMRTRHNIGFATIDNLQLTINTFSNWKLEKKLEAEVSRGHIASCCEDVILAKPQTFMNRSGGAVQQLITNYKLQITDFLVIHDDLDLELGTLRLSHGSGSAGHNGVQSIIDILGTKDFWRLRIGIGPRTQSPSLKIRPPARLDNECSPSCRLGEEGGEGYDDTAKFVLKPFSRAEQPKLKKSIAGAVAAIQLMFSKGPAAAQTEINKT